MMPLRLDADISQRQRDAGLKRYNTAYVKVAATSESQLNSSSTILNLKVRAALLRHADSPTFNFKVHVQYEGTSPRCVQAISAK